MIEHTPKLKKSKRAVRRAHAWPLLPCDPTDARQLSLFPAEPSDAPVRPEQQPAEAASAK